MRKVIAVLAIVMLMGLTECGYHNLMAKVPNHAFDKFEYHREQIDEATTVEVVEAININEGWPA